MMQCYADLCSTRAHWTLSDLLIFMYPFAYYLIIYCYLLFAFISYFVFFLLLDSKWPFYFALSLCFFIYLWGVKNITSQKHVLQLSISIFLLRKWNMKKKRERIGRSRITTKMFIYKWRDVIFLCQEVLASEFFLRNAKKSILYCEFNFVT